MAMFETEQEAEEYIEELIQGLFEREVDDDVPGYEKTVYSSLSSEDEGGLEVHVFQPGLPTDESLITLVVEEDPSVTSVLGEVRDDSVKRIIVVDLGMDNMSEDSDDDLIMDPDDEQPD